MFERACESVGIDLGTTYSSLAYVDQQGTPRIVADSSGQTVIPSVVYFGGDEIIVGDLARQEAKVDSDRAVQFIKVYMGESWRKTFDGHEHTPESISAIILSHLVREAEPHLGPISKAVITVPAYFTEKRRRATQQAGEIAGLEVIGMLNEPMAATMAYGIFRNEEEQKVLVYDLGGGTFDVTIVRISPTEIEELATRGNRRLGGRDWDQCLLDHVVDDFREKHNVDPREDEQAMYDLLQECEMAKRRLSRMAKAPLRFHASGIDHKIEISRETFEDITAPLLQTTKLTAEIALEDAGLNWSELSRIVLVGGSTHMPAVRQMLEGTAGFAPDRGVNPVTSVALGAAIYAQMLEAGQAIKAIRQVTAEEADDESPADQQDSPQVATLVDDDSAANAIPFDIDIASTEPTIAEDRRWRTGAFADDQTISDEPTLAEKVHNDLANAEATLAEPIKVEATQVDRAHTKPTSAEVTDGEPADVDDNSDDVIWDPPATNEFGAVKPDDIQTGDDSPTLIPGRTIRFVTAHGVGVKTQTRGGWRNTVLIPGNTAVPVSVNKRFVTASKTGFGSRVNVVITQGDSTDMELVEILGNGRIEDLPADDAAGQPVKVYMEFDEVGRLHISAVYENTGDEMVITLDIPGGLKQEEVQAHREFLRGAKMLSVFDPDSALASIDQYDDEEEDEDDGFLSDL